MHINSKESMENGIFIARLSIWGETILLNKTSIYLKSLLLKQEKIFKIYGKV